MKNSFGILVLIIFMISAAFTGCIPNIGLVSGSGEIISLEYDLSDFSEIEISSAFEFEITQSSGYSVIITSYENLFDYFDVETDGDTLNVGMKFGSFTTSNPVVKITLPHLESLVISGACHGKCKGISSTDDLYIEESGASSLDIDAAVDDCNIEISGASNIKGTLSADDLDIEISGASRAELSGEISELELDVSGASTADLEDLTTEYAEADVSGASTAHLYVTERLKADVSGASTVNYRGDADLSRISISGASSLNHE